MANSNSTDVVGYAYEAALHCVSCAEKRFGATLFYRDPIVRDGEGNEVGAVFQGEGAYEECNRCDGSGDVRCTCGDCGDQHENTCEDCGGEGDVSRRCDDCGEELVG